MLTKPFSHLTLQREIASVQLLEMSAAFAGQKALPVPAELAYGLMPG